MKNIKSFTSKSAIDFETGDAIALPFSLQTKFEVDPSINFTPQFYVIKAQLPYGLDEREGEIIICGDLWSASVFVAAWTFNGEPWREVNRYPEEYGILVDISYYESLPHDEVRYSWTPPGITETFSDNKNWERISEKVEPFRDFIRRVKHLK